MFRRAELTYILLVQALIALVITSGPLNPSKNFIKENLNNLILQHKINSAY